MKIQSILIRDGGTRVVLDTTEYHFEPLADGAHVADVGIEAHIDRFLSIPEGFKLYHGSDAPKGEPKEVALRTPVAMPPAPVTGNPMLAGSEAHPPQFDVNGTVYSQREIVERAFAASNLTSDEWNELGDDDRAARIDIVLDEIADGHDQGDENPALDAAASREELVALYEARFGKKPNGKLSIEKIKAELEL